VILATATVVVAGDAVVSRDHYEHGQVLEQSFDLAQARSSLAELAEVADQLIPGHDNLFVPFSSY
jgi:glyoxylase-like metal-dependent hydrolase (beta-lactamase superfamily II)